MASNTRPNKVNVEIKNMPDNTQMQHGWQAAQYEHKIAGLTMAGSIPTESFAQSYYSITTMSYDQL